MISLLAVLLWIVMLLECELISHAVILEKMFSLYSFYISLWKHVSTISKNSFKYKSQIVKNMFKIFYK